MSEARIPPVEDLSQQQLELLEKTLHSQDGRPLNIFATLAHHPLLLRRITALGDTFLGNGALPARDRELVILRVAAVTASGYEWAHHSVIGRQVGLDAELDWLLEPLHSPSSSWTENERQLLSFADELLTSASVGDKTWRDVAADRTPAELLELVMLIGFYQLLAVFLRSVRVERDPGLPEPPPQAGSWQ